VTRRPTGDDGVAAAEFALLLTVLIALVALVAPISYLFFERVQLGRTAGDTIRFATSRSDEARTVPAPTIPAGALPTNAHIAQEAARAHSGRAAVSVQSVSRTSDASCPSRRRVQITLTTTVDVGPFVGLLLSDGTRTLTATATSCEE
jgi:Flp pilus assembly protein TadG